METNNTTMKCHNTPSSWPFGATYYEHVNGERVAFSLGALQAMARTRTYHTLEMIARGALPEVRGIVASDVLQILEIFRKSNSHTNCFLWGAPYGINEFWYTSETINRMATRPLLRLMWRDLDKDGICKSCDVDTAVQTSILASMDPSAVCGCLRLKAEEECPDHKLYNDWTKCVFQCIKKKWAKSIWQKTRRWFRTRWIMMYWQELPARNATRAKDKARAVNQYKYDFQEIRPLMSDC